MHLTSHVTRHTSHVTRHTSHVTRHTSHATGHKAEQQQLAALHMLIDDDSDAAAADVLAQSDNCTAPAVNVGPIAPAEISSASALQTEAAEDASTSPLATASTTPSFSTTAHNVTIKVINRSRCVSTARNYESFLTLCSRPLWDLSVELVRRMQMQTGSVL
jgi:hypothetical protein